MYIFSSRSSISFLWYSSLGTYLLARSTGAIIIPVACYYFYQFRHQAIWWLAAHATFTSSSIWGLRWDWYCCAYDRRCSCSSGAGEELEELVI